MSNTLKLTYSLSYILRVNAIREACIYPLYGDGGGPGGSPEPSSTSMVNPASSSVSGLGSGPPPSSISTEGALPRPLSHSSILFVLSHANNPHSSPYLPTTYQGTPGYANANASAYATTRIL
ncbi:hypothetical protein D9758_015287 [Tetrapyrgos nigripes]|uniref:Uncharacterized protein n=1 Tax=Tetrapyrgos nigripes TaxID=182062 RepID=A0A8H5CMX9_9AGAR|nr:hypothetical protein D9758_015287 [Tetrapyrgos nigripes]